jgi:hypothetical protein
MLCSIFRVCDPITLRERMFCSGNLLISGKQLIPWEIQLFYHMCKVGNGMWPDSSKLDEQSENGHYLVIYFTYCIICHQNCLPVVCFVASACSCHFLITMLAVILDT